MLCVDVEPACDRQLVAPERNSSSISENDCIHMIYGLLRMYWSLLFSNIPLFFALNHFHYACCIGTIVHNILNTVSIYGSGF